MSDERELVTKKARLDMDNSVAGPSQIQHAAAVPPLTASILKLDVDCFEELFEWLSLAQLRALRQTCKRLKQVVDYFIKANYPAVKIGFGRITLGKYYCEKVKEFDPIKLKMIKRAKITAEKMTDEMIDDMKEVLPQLEILELDNIDFKANFHESILKSCSNLKNLSIWDTKFVGDDSNNESHWLKYQHPTIEHLLVYYSSWSPARLSTELPTFLQLNPNIQTFSVSYEIITSYGNRFIESNIKIERLDVAIDNMDVHIVHLCNVLNELHERGFHKRLHLFVQYLNQAFMDRIALIRGVKNLYISPVESNISITFPLMPDLQELCVDDYISLENVDLNSTAKNLINLERIYFENGSIEAIIPFIRNAAKLKEIKIDRLDEDVHFKNEVIRLSALNKERKGLAGACKVTFYVEEDVFLSTKFATTKTEFNLVTLKRTEAVEWIPDYFFNYD